MTTIRTCAALAAALGVALSSGSSYAAEPFAGTWSPTCKPAPGKEIDNNLATIVFFEDAVKFADVQCAIGSWKKKGERYRTDLTCFTKNVVAPAKRKMAVRPVGEKIRVHISGAYKQTVERCG